MRYNPCGKAVDWLSSCYTTKARLHADPAAPLVDIVWYFTEQDFQKHPSIINSKFWSSENARETLVGEQWPYPPWPEKPRAVGGFQAEHECGEPDDFLEGQPWPYNGPPVQYDEDNIPYCCPRIRPPKLTSGGALSATHKYTPPAYGLDCCDAPLNVMGQTTGAVMGAPFLGGDGLDLWFRWENPGDSITLTATGTLIPPVVVLSVWNGPTCGATSEVYIAPSSGTFCVGGLTPGTVCVRVQQFVAATQPVTVRVSEGGQCGPDLPIVGGGAPAAQTGRIHTDPAAGGGEAGGAAGDVYGFTDAAAGGGEAGGEAGDVLTFTDGTDGGGEAGGEAGDVPSYTDTADGGGEAGGSAGDVFLAAVPTVRDSTSGHTGSGVYTLPTRVSGDLLVAFISTASGTPTAGSGWSNGGIITDPTSGMGFALFRRISNGTDSAPTGVFTASYVIFSVQNAATVDATANKVGSTAATTLLTTSLSPSRVSGSLVAWATAAAITSPTYPSGYAMTTELAALPDIAAGFAVAHTGIPVNPSLIVTTATTYLSFNLLFH